MNEELSLPCRYKVYTNSERSSYTFSTDTKANYDVLLSPTPELFVSTALEGVEVYSIIIAKKKGGTGKRDPEIVHTISAILNDFFAKGPDRILAYSCERDDTKHLQRKRLFDMWYTNNNTDYIKMNGQLDDDGEIYYTGIIFHKENVFGEEVISETFGLVQAALQESKN